MFGIELGQRVQAPPRVVGDGCVLVVWSDREVSNVEPVEERGLFLVLGDVVELEEPAAGMIEDPVENDPDAALVCSSEHRVESLVAAEHRVDAEVIVGVIAVVRGALKDRVEPKGVNPQFGEVVEFVGHAPEISALVAMKGGWLVPRFEAHP